MCLELCTEIFTVADQSSLNVLPRQTLLIWCDLIQYVKECFKLIVLLLEGLVESPIVLVSEAFEELKPLNVVDHVVSIAVCSIISPVKVCFDSLGAVQHAV